MPYNRVKELRTKHHITSTELAKSIGVDHKTIRSYEEGISDTKTEILKRIAQFFHVSTDYILGLSEYDIKTETNQKKYAFSGDALQIINNLPNILYYGTTRSLLDTIKLEGLKPITRWYVYLSDNYETALNIAIRQGEPVVLEVDAVGMSRDGAVFYLSQNGVWLTKYVKPEYLNVHRKK